MKLHTLKPASGSTKTRKRIGRGQGSGKGGTSTRGHKGAKSRSGYSQKSGYEGGQMPLQRRLPKFGFTNKFRIEFKGVNLDVIQELAEKAKVETIDVGFLIEHGIISKNERVKVLGRGKEDLKVKINVSAHAFSSSAAEAIEKVGGTITKL